MAAGEALATLARSESVAFLEALLLPLVFLSLLLLLRVVSVLPGGNRPAVHRSRGETVKAMFVLGSGGHTKETLELARKLGANYSPRIYVVADTDSFSDEKARQLEQSRGGMINVDFIIERIPRAREVGQSYITSVFSTLVGMRHAVSIIAKHRPNVVISTGPGTCVPIYLAAYIPRILGLQHISLIYVESFCRVQSLSLSGRILYPLSDRFIVHWKQLTQKYSRAEYLGVLF